MAEILKMAEICSSKKYLDSVHQRIVRVLKKLETEVFQVRPKNKNIEIKYHS